jgi:phage-related protein
MNAPRKTLQAVFYRSINGSEPVRDWLLTLDKEDRKTIGEDIATLEFCWPIGKPKCSPMKGIKGLYEVRSNISSTRIARVLFTIVGNQMILLHGFNKKTQQTPKQELDLAGKRLREVRQNVH